MPDSSTALAVGSVLLIVLNAYFVATEYALVSARRSKLESLKRKGNARASSLAHILENLSPLVAASQIAITMIGIGVGSFTEPFATELLQHLLGPNVSPKVGFVLSFLVVTFVLVVVGELVPKYVVLRDPEKVAMFTYRPLVLFSKIFSPLIALAEGTAGLILRAMGVKLEKERTALQREELLVLIQSGFTEGTLEKDHALVVARALKIDQLAAGDIMVHRLDIQWLDVTLAKDQLLKRLKQIPFTRLPVCRGDIDDLVGIVYLHDIVKHLDDAPFSLEKICRPIVAVPENLPVERIIGRMKDQKTQILIVMDEYGGTSGLLTLEDVVEEVFGELHDTLESERPQIEVFSTQRISAAADIRFDEIIDQLGIPYASSEPSTDTLAQLIVDQLGRVPRPGDIVVFELGQLRVENMTRRRITRVTVLLTEEFSIPKPAEDENQDQ